MASRLQDRGEVVVETEEDVSDLGEQSGTDEESTSDGGSDAEKVAPASMILKISCIHPTCNSCGSLAAVLSTVLPSAFPCCLLRTHSSGSSSFAECWWHRALEEL